MLTDEFRVAAAARVFARLEEMAEFGSAERVLLYYALPDELPTQDFIRRWCGRKSFFLPRVCGDSLEVLPYDVSALRVGAFGIEEPVGNESVPVESMDLAVIPAMAYDFAGRRVGRGKGYYDRLLTGVGGVVKIGVVFDFQLVDAVSADEHDVPVDVVIAESGVYDCRR